MANHKAVIMPISTAQMIEDLISNHRLSIKEIAHSLDVTSRTIYRLQKNEAVSSKLMANLIGLYCRVTIIKNNHPSKRSRCLIKKVRR
jgi:hypothetical protein